LLSIEPRSTQWSSGSPEVLGFFLGNVQFFASGAASLACAHRTMVLDASAAERFKIERHIGSGSFGDVYIGIDSRTGERVALKVEASLSKSPRLFHEAKIYKSLTGRPGFAQLRHCGMEARRNVLVVDLLGATLEELFHLCGRRFSFKTVCMLADQAIERLEAFHAEGWVHRDIKPENLLIGNGEDSGLVHLIDFGMAKRFRDAAAAGGQHVDFKQCQTVKGTVRYASLNACRAGLQSRRDDLEALGFVLVYFMRGSLPWQSLPKAFTRRVQMDKLVEMKTSTSFHELCDGLEGQEVLVKYLTYCRRLDFKECPDYSYLRGLFVDALAREGHCNDLEFDWVGQHSVGDRLQQLKP